VVLLHPFRVSNFSVSFFYSLAKYDNVYGEKKNMFRKGLLKGHGRYSKVLVARYTLLIYNILSLFSYSTENEVQHHSWIYVVYT